MSEMSTDLFPIFALLSMCAAGVALATLVVMHLVNRDEKPVRVRVRIRRDRCPFPPETDDTFPAHTGFATRIAPRGPPVSNKPPLPDDDPARPQA